VGKTYHFECPHCHYRARVSGGVDEGTSCRVQTILCHDCRELFDVFTRVRKRQQATVTKRTLMYAEIVIPPALLVQQPLREFQEKPASRPQPPPSFWENLAIFCPVTRSHRVESWSDPGRCPRCGNFLEKNGYPWKLWD
jgi:transposase-like protein